MPKKLMWSVFLLLVLVTLLPATALADRYSLPDSSLFKPDMDMVVLTVGGVFRVINWALGVFGMIGIVLAIYRVVSNVVSAMRGRGHLDYVGELKFVGIGILLLVAAITGLWYQILIFLWNAIIPSINKTLETSPMGLIISEQYSLFS